MDAAYARLTRGRIWPNILPREQRGGSEDDRNLLLLACRTPLRWSFRRVTSIVALGLAMVLVPVAVGGRQPVLSSGPLGTGGTIVALGHGSITVGVRPDVVAWYKAVHPNIALPPNLTCALGGGSPAIVGFHVGEYVALRCSSGTLTLIQPDRQWAGGKILTLGAGSIKVGGGFPSLPGLPPPIPDDLLCSLGPPSPKVTLYQVGSEIRIECLGGVLTRVLRGTNGWNGYAESGGGSITPPSTAGF